MIHAMLKSTIDETIISAGVISQIKFTFVCKAMVPPLFLTILNDI